MCTKVNVDRRTHSALGLRAITEYEASDKTRVKSERELTSTTTLLNAFLRGKERPVGHSHIPESPSLIRTFNRCHVRDCWTGDKCRPS